MELTLQEALKLMVKNGGNLNLDGRKDLTALPENIYMCAGNWS